MNSSENMQRFNYLEDMIKSGNDFSFDTEGRPKNKKDRHF
jgi:hypothetical protein